MRQFRHMALALALFAAIGFAGHARAEDWTDAERFQTSVFFYGAPRGWFVNELEQDNMLMRMHTATESKDLAGGSLIVLELKLGIKVDWKANRETLIAGMINSFNANGARFVEDEKPLIVAGREAVHGVVFGNMDGTDMRMNFLCTYDRGTLFGAMVAYPDGTPQEQDAMMDAFVRTLADKDDEARTTPSAPPTAQPAVQSSIPQGDADWRQAYSDVDFVLRVRPFADDERIGTMIRVEGRLSAKEDQEDALVWTVRQANGQEWSAILNRESDAGVPINANVICYGIYTGMFEEHGDEPDMVLLRYEVSFTAAVGGVDQASIYENMSFEEIHRLLSQ